MYIYVYTYVYMYIYVETERVGEMCLRKYTLYIICEYSHICIKRDMYLHKATTHVGNMATTSTCSKSGDATSTKLHELLMLPLPYSYGVPPLHYSYEMPVPPSQWIANYVHKYNLSCVHVCTYIYIYIYTFV